MLPGKLFCEFRPGFYRAPAPGGGWGKVPDVCPGSASESSVFTHFICWTPTQNLPTVNKRHSTPHTCRHNTVVAPRFVFCLLAFSNEWRRTSRAQFVNRNYSKSHGHSVMTDEGELS